MNSGSKAPSFDIVLPCFNPSADWTGRVLTAWKSIENVLPAYSFRLILVNDGSTTGIETADIELLQSEVASFVYLNSNPNMGKGFALRKGVEAAKAPFVIYTDIDFPYEEKSLLEVARLLVEEGADVVAGVRADAYYDGVPADRRRISRFLRWMLRTFLRLKVTDTQCGLKGFNQKGRQIFLKTGINRFLFDLEFIFLASSAKEIKLLPAEAHLKPGIVFSHVSIKVLMGEAWNFMRVLFRAVRKP